MLSFYLKNNELLNLCIASSLVLCKNNTMESLCNRFNTPYSNMRRSLANLSSLINELDDQTTIEKIHKEYVITTQKQTDPLFICDKIHNYYLEHSIKFQLVQAIICDEITHEFRLCEHLNISTTYLAALLKKINNHLSKFKVKLEKHNRNIRLGGSYQNTVFYIYQFQYKFPSRSLIERYQKYKPYKKELNFKKNMNFFLLNNIKYSSLITKKIPLFSKEEINQLDQLLNSYFSYSFEDKNINANKFLNLLYLLTSPFDEEKFNANNFLNSISYTNTSKSMFSYE
ncbi:helix-turn-helix domain-containing protein, partial [Vagococcus fessus]